MQLKTPTMQPSFSWLGVQDYAEAMKKIQLQVQGLKDAQQSEHVFCCEHPPIYTTGRRRIDNRVQKSLPAPLLITDRGGETTFHGPGQLMFYPVICLSQRKLAVSCYVSWLEKSCIQLCASLGVQAQQRSGFPGVWVGQQKIAAVGLRVRHGIVYHGMALNLDVDLCWFAAIQGCGLSTPVVNLQTLTKKVVNKEVVAKYWYKLFCHLLEEGCGEI